MADKSKTQSGPPAPAPEVKAPEVKAPAEPRFIMERPPGDRLDSFRPGAMSEEETANYEQLVAVKVANGLTPEDARQVAWRQIVHDRPTAAVA